MKVSERFAIIDRIGGELEERFTFREIDAYLNAMGINTPHPFGSSRRDYVKQTLSRESPAKVIELLEDLEMDVASAAPAATAARPSNWTETNDFRLFISHISKDKDKAERLKVCLSPYAISAFVAHDDIEPTREWQVEVERALFSMESLVAVHTAGFSRSVWTQQEIGFALGRRIKVISFKMGEDPTGFISKRQALARGTRTAEEIAQEIVTLLNADPMTAARMKSAEASRSAGIGKDETAL